MNVYNDHLANICKIYENTNDFTNNFDRKVEWRKFLYVCSYRQKVPLHQASLLLLWLSLLSYLRVPTMLAVKSTLVLYAYTYPFINTLTHTLEQGSTNCGTQAKPGCQFCKQSFILTVMLICLRIIYGCWDHTTMAELNKCKKLQNWITTRNWRLCPQSLKYLSSDPLNKKKFAEPYARA